VTRTKRLFIHVSEAEKRRIHAKATSLGYRQFGAYARAVLPDPFGPFTRSRLTDLLRSLHVILEALDAGDETARDRLGALMTDVRAWLD
jgi:hypothetical protein